MGAFPKAILSARKLRHGRRDQNRPSQPAQAPVNQEQRGLSGNRSSLTMEPNSCDDG